MRDTGRKFDFSLGFIPGNRERMCQGGAVHTLFPSQYGETPGRDITFEFFSNIAKTHDIYFHSFQYVFV